MLRFKGLIPAPTTPMNEDGSINYDAIPKQVAALVATGGKIPNH
jgi:dihydrodipicolinate synthase/N-acetylneuraminate lyase